MSRSQKRQDQVPRYGLSPHCVGKALHGPSGGVFTVRGIDVSQHGMGCVIVGHIKMRDAMICEIAGHKIPFEVMWVESHLGIENTYRVGLQCLDRMLNVREKMGHLGFLTVPVDDGFAA